MYPSILPQATDPTMVAPPSPYLPWVSAILVIMGGSIELRTVVFRSLEKTPRWLVIGVGSTKSSATLFTCAVYRTEVLPLVPLPCLTDERFLTPVFGAVATSSSTVGGVRALSSCFYP